MKSDKPLEQINYLLEEMKLKKVNISPNGVTAVVCRDGVVIFDLDEEKGVSIFIVKDYDRVNISLDLSQDEIEDFNGGKGIRVRCFGYKK